MFPQKSVVFDANIEAISLFSLFIVSFRFEQLDRRQAASRISQITWSAAAAAIII